MEVIVAALRNDLARVAAGERRGGGREHPLRLWSIGDEIEHAPTLQALTRT